MKRYDEGTLRAVFAKTNGRCHLCWRQIAFSNYAIHEARGGWEVDHSVPVSEGGTDHLNNLLPAHTSWGRIKFFC
ncbi:MAG: HNH endonuclease [bacterium]